MPLRGTRFLTDFHLTLLADISFIFAKGKTMGKTATATPAPRRLSDLAPAGGDFTAMEDIRDRDLRLIEFTPRATQFGNGYVLTLIDDDNEEAFECLTSAMVVCKQLDAIREKGDPFESLLVRFEKPGAYWMIA